MTLEDAIKTALENSIKYDKTYYVMRFWSDEPNFYSVITRDEKNKLYPLIFDCLYAFDAGDLLKAIDLKAARQILKNDQIEPIVDSIFTTRFEDL